MKKVLFALVAIALVFVSCKKTDDKKTDPKTDALTIKLEVVGGPTVTGAVIKCTPSDTSIYYAQFCVPTAQLSKATAQALSEQIYAAIAEASFETYAFHGVEECDWEGILEPETQYTPVAIQIDQKNTVYETVYQGAAFTTLAQQKSTMTIGITYDGVDDVTFNPTGTDTYLYYMIDVASLDSIGAAEATIEEVGEFALGYYAEYASDYYVTGPITDNISNWAYQAVQTGDNVWAMAAPMASGVVNGTMTTAVLTVGTSVEAAARQIPMNRRAGIKMMRK